MMKEIDPNTRILIIDDDPSNIHEIVFQLKKLQLHKGAMTANNGQKGLQLAKKFLPDIILTDWQMPELDGFQLVEALKKDSQTMHIPIIMITAVMIQPEQLSDSFKAGVHDFLAKPFNELEFLARVSNVIHLSQVENKLRKNYQELQKLDQAKSTFFANVSHDLKNPISLILGMSDLLIDEHEDVLPLDTMDKLRTIQRFGSSLNKLSDEIRELIRLDEGILKLNRKPINIHQYFQEIVEIFQPHAENEGVTIHFESNIDKNEKGFVDPWQFEKVIFNILSNALSFSNKGDNVSLKLTKEDSQWHIDISDEGPGIKEADLEQLFNRYYSKQHSRQGLGIGLSIAKEIIGLHGGRIKAENNKKKGTTFRITIPYSEESRVASDGIDEIGQFIKDKLSESDESKSAESVPKVDIEKCILIVDDHPDIRLLLSELLKSKYRIFEAEDGEKALDKLNKHHVDLIITDLSMPVLDGFEFINAMKESKYSNLPVLIVSSRVSKEDLYKAIETGADAIIPKPFDAKELQLRIENLIHKKKSTDHIDLFDKYDSDNTRKEMVRQLEALVLKNLDNPLFGINDLANEIAVSQRKLFNLLRESLELTPLDFIKKIRFQYSKTLIDQRRVNNLSEAAKAIGMSNVTAFSKQFESRYGIKPVIKK